MKKIINGIVAPFRFNQNFKGLSLGGKIIGILYFPMILIMWYGYYVWRIQNEM